MSNVQVQIFILLYCTLNVWTRRWTWSIISLPCQLQYPDIKNHIKNPVQCVLCHVSVHVKGHGTPVLCNVYCVKFLYMWKVKGHLSSATCPVEHVKSFLTLTVTNILCLWTMPCFKCQVSWTRIKCHVPSCHVLGVMRHLHSWAPQTDNLAGEKCESLIAISNLVQLNG